MKSAALKYFTTSTKRNPRMELLQAVPTNGAMPQQAVPKPKSKITSIEPWHEEVGPEILEEISSELTKRIYLDDGKALLAITWVAHANMFADFDVTPRLAITAPSSECGKSTLSNALLEMTDNCLGSEALTDAAFIRYAARGKMVFHWDEADETFNRYSKGKDITKALTVVGNVVEHSISAVVMTTNLLRCRLMRLSHSLGRILRRVFLAQL